MHIDGSAPFYLYEKFTLSSAVSVRNTRASSNKDFFMSRVEAGIIKTGTFYHFIFPMERVYLKQQFFFILKKVMKKQNCDVLLLDSI